MRSDVRDKGLNALRQLIDDVDSGRFPGLYLLITGTPAFYDGPQGVSRLTPLAQRLATDFGTDARFDSPRAVQIRLSGFDLPKLTRLGTTIRDLYAQGSGAAGHGSRALVDDAYVADLRQGRSRRTGRPGWRGAPRVPAQARRRRAGPGGGVPRLRPAAALQADPVPHRADRRGAQRGGVPARVRRRGGTRPVTELAGLHPTLAHHLVGTLGWTELRPLQQAAIAPVMAGQDVLLLAPTAGGKTEAAAFPVLSRMAAEGWRGLSVLYLCPLKALLNNLLPRLETYGGWTGRRVALWHGDTTGSRRRSMLADPPDLLLTTPESLESMLVSVNVDHHRLFAGLQAVIVDEVHAFGLRRPRVAPACGAGTADPALRASAAADRPVRHRRQPGGTAALAAGIGGRKTAGRGRRPGTGVGERDGRPRLARDHPERAGAGRSA